MEQSEHKAVAHGTRVGAALVEQNGEVALPDQIATDANKVLGLPEGTEWVRREHPEHSKHDNLNKLRAKLREGGIKKVDMPCGHKVDPAHFPKLNCRDCWNIVLLANKDKVVALLKVIDDGGEVSARALLGNKVVKHIKRVAREYPEYLKDDGPSPFDTEETA